MNRRCTDGVCLMMAGAKTFNLDLPVATILANPKNEWNRLASGGNGRIRIAHEIDVDWKKFNQDDYLMSHCSIVASVELEEDGHTIKAVCNDLVNNNGNAWSNEVLLATFRTFIGGENYLEHVQVPELSKGKLLDAVARPIHLKTAMGEADIYYIDILVATNRKHSDLVRKIASGKLTTMSMGCLADFVQCSRCGKVLGDNDTNCNHLENEMLRKYTDRKGIQRVTAELCGRSIMKNGKRVGDPKSCKFIEASWVLRPAFTGAVLNHYVSDISKEASKILAYPTSKLSETMEDIFKMRVADRTGMLVLKVARAELMRRKHEAMIERISGRII